MPDHVHLLVGVEPQFGIHMLVKAIKARSASRRVDELPAPGQGTGRGQSRASVDRGVVVAVATSAGDLLDRAFVTAGERRRAVALQRKLSRAVAGSANRAKTRAALAEVRARERRRRLDFCQKAAHQLAYANAVVVLEKLPVKNMTRRARPVWDPDNPGGFLPNGAAAKSGLNRAILSKGLVPV
jgi:putative transposase